MVTPHVCVIFTARERFSRAARSLKALFRSTSMPFKLIMVEAGVPKRYRTEMRQALAGRSAEIIEREGFLLPNQARNLALTQADTEFILFLENDCSPRPGFLERLVSAAREFPAAAALPWIWEAGERHQDQKLGTIEESSDGSIWFRQTITPSPPEGDRSRIELFECHCFLMRQDALKAVGPFDEELNTDEHIDLALKLRRAGLSVVLEPKAQVDFFPPPPVRDDELDFYRFRWERAVAESGNARVRERWRINNMTTAAEFAKNQQKRIGHLSWLLHRLAIKLDRAWTRLFPRLQQ